MHLHEANKQLFKYYHILFPASFSVPSSPWDCSVADVDRKPCGPESISRMRCEEFGCCYDIAQSVCYHSPSNGKIITLIVLKYKTHYVPSVCNL